MSVRTSTIPKYRGAYRHRAAVAAECARHTTYGRVCVLMERRSFRRTATFCDAETLELRGRLMQNRELQRIALAIKDYEPYRMYVASPLSSVPLSLLGRSR